MSGAMGAAGLYNGPYYYSRSEVRIRNNRIRRERIFKRQLIILSILVSLALFFIVFLGASFLSDAQDDEYVPMYKYYKSITVHADDTINSIAEYYYSDDNYSGINEYISEICRINSISDPRMLRAGEQLIVPYYSSEFK